MLIWQLAIIRYC